ncbi:hypothetical protein Plhal304r1_c008g0031121 [Plasmopara halstedii]
MVDNLSLLVCSGFWKKIGSLASTRSCQGVAATKLVAGLIKRSREQQVEMFGLRYKLLMRLVSMSGALGNIHALSYCTILWGLNGLMLSSGYVAVMGKNGCLGNIVGTVLITSMFALVEKALAWKIALVVAAGLDSIDVMYRYQ